MPAATWLGIIPSVSALLDDLTIGIIVRHSLWTDASVSPAERESPIIGWGMVRIVSTGATFRFDWKALLLRGFRQGLPKTGSIRRQNWSAAPVSSLRVMMRAPLELRPF